MADTQSETLTLQHVLQKVNVLEDRFNAELLLRERMQKQVNENSELTNQLLSQMISVMRKLQILTEPPPRTVAAVGTSSSSSTTSTAPALPFSSPFIAKSVPYSTLTSTSPWQPSLRNVSISLTHQSHQQQTSLQQLPQQPSQPEYNEYIDISDDNDNSNNTEDQINKKRKTTTAETDVPATTTPMSIETTPTTTLPNEFGIYKMSSNNNSNNNNNNDSNIQDDSLLPRSPEYLDPNLPRSPEYAAPAETKSPEYIPPRSPEYAPPSQAVPNLSSSPSSSSSTPQLQAHSLSLLNSSKSLPTSNYNSNYSINLNNREPWRHNSSLHHIINNILLTTNYSKKSTSSHSHPSPTKKPENSDSDSGETDKETQQSDFKIVDEYANSINGNATPMKKKWKTWEERFQDLKEFFEKNGHFRVPCQPDASFYHWVYEQRRAKDKLPVHQKQLLEQIGFTWDLQTRKEQTEIPSKWMERYQQLKTFFEANGPAKLPLDAEFSRWWSKQRNSKKKGLLSNKQIELLDEIESKITPQTL